MTSPRVRFSFLLPLIELTIWIVIVIIPATLAYLDLRARYAPGEPVTIGSITAPYETARRMAFQDPAMQASHFIAALNMPAYFIEFLVSVPISWPSSWHPEGMIPDVWRGLSFPFFALPAWCFAGRGIDAFLLRQKPGRVATVIATVFSVLSVALFCGIRFGLSSSEREGLTLPLWGFVLWAAMFAAFPAAWSRCRRAGTKTRKTAAVAETE